MEMTYNNLIDDSAHEVRSILHNRHRVEQSAAPMNLVRTLYRAMSKFSASPKSSRSIGRGALDQGDKGPGRNVLREVWNSEQLIEYSIRGRGRVVEHQQGDTRLEDASIDIYGNLARIRCRTYGTENEVERRDDCGLGVGNVGRKVRDGLRSLVEIFFRDRNEAAL